MFKAPQLEISSRFHEPNLIGYEGFISTHTQSQPHLQSFLVQVGQLRATMMCDQDERVTHLDSHGLKVLFNHGIRRFMTGAKNSVSRMNF